MTRREHGRGRITCVGGIPERDLARGLFQWVGARDRGPWDDVPESVTTTGATAPDGRRLGFLHNWSWTPAVARLPVAVTDVLTSQDAEADHVLELGPACRAKNWDVAVLVER